jgi:hypothetical protein
VLIEANAREMDRLGADGALRGGADSADICRPVMGVAAVADRGWWHAPGQPVGQAMLSEGIGAVRPELRFGSADLRSPAHLEVR